MQKEKKMANYAAHTYLLVSDGLRDSLLSVVRQRGGKQALAENKSSAVSWWFDVSEHPVHSYETGRVQNDISNIIINNNNIIVIVCSVYCITVIPSKRVPARRRRARINTLRQDIRGWPWATIYNYSLY